MKGPVGIVRNYADICQNAYEMKSNCFRHFFPLFAAVGLLVAGGCGSRPAASLPLIVLHPHEEEPADLRSYTGVFLAGTIDMGNSVDWQREAAETFARREGNYILYNPRQDEWHPEREGEMDYQVNWELEHLEKADWILMYFLPESLSPITLLEFGLYARSGKLVVVCPPEFYRYDNIRISCRRYSVPLFSSLEEAFAQESLF